MAQQPAQRLRFRSYLADGSAIRGWEGAAEVEIIDPWSGDVAAVLECGGQGAVEAAVRAAGEACRQHSAQTRGQRAQWLESAG
jgi:acyl-CoA reductase-like NAD-dependent aldehyde dehydrogenase